MAFSLISPQKARHSSGFIIQGGDRYHIEYVEFEHVLRIPVEDRLDPPYEIYWDQANKWEPPFDTEIISEEKKQEIISRVQEGAKYLGFSFLAEN